MAKKSKRLEAIREKIGDRCDPRPIDEVLALLKDVATVKFDESVEAAINLGVDSRKSDQNVRGSTVLPHGTGKSMRVAVFAEGSDADAGREAGADLVGLEDLAEEIKKGNMELLKVIATHIVMALVLGGIVLWLANMTA